MRSRTGRTPAVLWVVLVLVLAAFGLLVAALVTSRPVLAWGSVAASGVAAGLLVADWLGRRRPYPGTGDGSPADPSDAVPGGAGPAPDDPETGVPATDPLDPDTEPAEESTDVADAIAVADLTDEVMVIDERPRYHLDSCRWVGDRETIPLPVAEARELGFTPCAVCRPDARLAAAHRTTH